MKEIAGIFPIRAQKVLSLEARQKLAANLFLELVHPEISPDISDDLRTTIYKELNLALLTSTPDEVEVDEKPIYEMLDAILNENSKRTSYLQNKLLENVYLQLRTPEMKATEREELYQRLKQALGSKNARLLILEPEYAKSVIDEFDFNTTTKEIITTALYSLQMSREILKGIPKATEITSDENAIAMSREYETEIEKQAEEKKRELTRDERQQIYLELRKTYAPVPKPKEAENPLNQAPDDIEAWTTTKTQSNAPETCTKRMDTDSNPKSEFSLDEKESLHLKLSNSPARLFQILKKIPYERGLSGQVERAVVKSEQGDEQKIVIKNVQDDEKEINREQLILNRMGLSLGSHRLNKNSIQFFMPYLGKNINHYLRKNDFSATQRLGAIDGLLTSLADIHSKKIIHGDVGPHNLGLRKGLKDAKRKGLKTAQCSATLYDFGLSEIEGEATRSTGRYATVAPEVLRGAVNTSASDVYSAAITMASILEIVQVETILFSLDDDQEATFEADILTLLKPKRSAIKIIEEKTALDSTSAAALYELILKNLDYNPDKRDTAADIMSQYQGLSSFNSTMSYSS